ncbi:MAG: tetratricopeptide repeat protein, partial [Pseudomonas sp.]
SGLLHHSLGLTLIRAGERDQALVELAKAAQLTPDDPQFNYIYAIALHDLGKPEEARNQLDALLKRQPTNRHARLALISYWHEAGQLQKVQVLQAELEQQNPDDPELQQAPNR